MNTIETNQKALVEARLHFKHHDQVMSNLLAQVTTKTGGIIVPTAKSPDQYFKTIVSTIISQQISTAAAKTITTRVYAALGTVTPASVLAKPELLAEAGVSPQKLRYLTGVATAWATLPISEFPELSDQEIVATLTSLPGLGVWSAEMFMLFTLGRTDIFSYRDLGLIQSVYRYYNYYPHYTKKIRDTVTLWSPYRTVASLTLWAARDAGIPASNSTTLNRS